MLVPRRVMSYQPQTRNHYNHLLKNVLYFDGETGLVSQLFPPPDYELPNNVFFELTGIAQFFAVLVAGWYVLRLFRLRAAPWVSAERDTR